MKRRRDSTAAFTLVEVIVSISIIIILIALLVPALQGVRDAARRTKCAANLHSIGIAVHLYVTTNAALPPGPRYSDARVAGPNLMKTLAPLLDLAPANADTSLSTGELPSGSPFICPADFEYGPTWRMSYEYWPGVRTTPTERTWDGSYVNPDMGEWRRALQLFERRPDLFLLREFSLFHAPVNIRNSPTSGFADGGYNMLMVDGSVERR